MAPSVGLITYAKRVRLWLVISDCDKVPIDFYLYHTYRLSFEYECYVNLWDSDDLSYFSFSVYKTTHSDLYTHIQPSQFYTMFEKVQRTIS